MKIIKLTTLKNLAIKLKRAICFKSCIPWYNQFGVITGLMQAKKENSDKRKWDFNCGTSNSKMRKIKIEIIKRKVLAYRTLLNVRFLVSSFFASAAIVLVAVKSNP